jgi:hypothetical protein
MHDNIILITCLAYVSHSHGTPIWLSADNYKKQWKNIFKLRRPMLLKLEEKEQRLSLYMRSVSENKVQVLTVWERPHGTDQVSACRLWESQEHTRTHTHTHTHTHTVTLTFIYTEYFCNTRQWIRLSIIINLQITAEKMVKGRVFPVLN